jgi:hypothetical protein
MCNCQGYSVAKLIPPKGIKKSIDFKLTLSRQVKFNIQSEDAAVMNPIPKGRGL